MSYVSRSLVRPLVLLFAYGGAGCSNDQYEHVQFPERPRIAGPFKEVPVGQATAIKGEDNSSPAIAEGQFASLPSLSDIATKSALAFAGTVKLQPGSGPFGAAQVRFIRRRADGRNVIHANGTAIIEPPRDNILNYRVELEAPEQPGTYLVEVSLDSPKNVISRGEVTAR
jgi:hypothetical protein